MNRDSFFLFMLTILMVLTKQNGGKLVIEIPNKPPSANLLFDYVYNQETDMGTAVISTDVPEMGSMQAPLVSSN